MGVSSKGLNQRMGKGKGSIDFWCANVHAGMVIYEVSGVGEGEALKSLFLSGRKLPVNTRVVSRRVGV